MKRSPARVWVILGVTAVFYSATLFATRRFPAAPLQPASVELRQHFEALKPFDAGSLAKVSAQRESAGASALSGVRAAELRSQLAQSWEVTALPALSVGDLSLLCFSLRRSTGWREQLAGIREVQLLPGVFVSAASVSARGGVLSVELHVAIIAHSQPADDKASGLPAVVPTSQNR